MRGRVRRIFRGLDDGADLLVIANAMEPHIDLTFFYATALTDGLFEGCSAYLAPDGGCEVVTSALEEEAAKQSGLKLHVYRKREERTEAMKRLLRGHGRIGINASELTYGAFRELETLAPKAKFQDVSRAVMRARLVKDEAELRLLRRAIRISCRAFEELLDAVHPGLREQEVAAQLVHLMQQRGATDASFRTIVGSGPNSAEPHYTAGPRRLRRGDFVVIDFGALYKMYHADVTRTIAVGRASGKQRAIYEVVHEAQARSLARMRPGAKGKTIDAVARATIDGSAYRGRFIHGLGHSIGLAVHDGAGLNPASEVVLRKDMVFTNEPGVYLPGFGGVRIEDDVLITANAPRVLSDAPRELLEVS